MRISHSQIFHSNLARLRLAFASVFQAQETVGTGKRINRPSDDPASLRPLLDVRAARSDLAQVSRNAGLLQADYSGLDHALQGLSGLLTEAQAAASQGVTGTANQGDRDGLAGEIDGLLDQALALANGRGVSGYLLGGSRQDLAPFELVATAVRERVLYRGDDRTIFVDLGGSIRLGRNIPGSEALRAGPRQPTVYTGGTGARAGSGTDSLRGSDQLVLAHTGTTLAGGASDPLSGLALGASAATLDTVLGDHTITLVDTSGTGAGGTVQLDGGPAIAWTAADTDLSVTTPEGDVIHLDLSAVSAGFSGTVAAAGTGTMSLDGGATSVATDFAAANQLVTDSQTGESIFVDATAIRRSGAELLSAPGTYDVFAALIELRDLLRNADGLAGDDQLARIRALLPELQAVQDHVLASLAEVGARSRMAQLSEARAGEMDLILAANAAELENADFAAATADLAQAETMLQASLTLSARLQNMPTLLDFI